MSGDLGKERRGEGGGEDLLSSRDVPDRLKEVVEGRILEDKAGDTNPYIFNKGWLGGGKVHHYYSRIGISLSDRFNKLQAGAASEDEIQENDIGFQFLPPDENIAVTQGSNHCYIRLLFEHFCKTLAKKAVVFHND